MTAKPKQTVVTNAGTDTIRAGWIKANENFDELFEKFSELVAYHTPAVTGAFQTGAVTDSAHGISVTGTSYLTTTTNAAGFISDASGNNNSYIFVNTGGIVRRVVQYYSGPEGVISINDGTSGEMLHVGFGSLGGCVCTYWHDSLNNQQMDVSRTVSPMPNINDGVPHKLEVEVVGDFVSAFVDEVCVAVWYDPIVSLLVGNSTSFYSQLVSTTARIWGWESYRGITERNPNPGFVRAGGVAANSVFIGNPDDADYAPTSLLYVMLRDGDPGVVVQGRQGGEFIFDATTAAGFGAGLKLMNVWDHELRLRCNHAATATLDFQGTTHISIANSGKLSFPDKLSNSVVADATDATTVIARLNELLAICRTVGIIST